MNELNLTEEEQQQLKTQVLQQESTQLRLTRQKVTTQDFEPLKLIGRGAYGEVWLCREKATQQLLAIKKLRKEEMRLKNQVRHLRAERDLLAQAPSPWIVELKYAFQDPRFLYLCMEFLPAGDLMTLLMNKDVLTTMETRFYAAEIVLAIETAHNLNYIHRDIKPDNILLDHRGHVKLTDFGLCSSAEDPELPAPSLVTISTTDSHTGRVLARSTVGTPNYIAPEVLSGQGYDETVDWWSLGVIVYEMLIGYPPFYSDQPATVCEKILNWKQVLRIPPDRPVSAEAADFILRLLKNPQDRLGSNGVDEIKGHAFFEGVDWGNIRMQEAPFVPEIWSEDDTHNFEEFTAGEPFEGDTPTNFQRKEPEFIGYTFKKGECMNALKNALEGLESGEM